MTNTPKHYDYNICRMPEGFWIEGACALMWYAHHSMHLAPEAQVSGVFYYCGVKKMKWPKLLKKMYQAILSHDIKKEKELFEKALKKNIKANLKDKKTTVTQVTVQD